MEISRFDIINELRGLGPVGILTLGDKVSHLSILVPTSFGRSPPLWHLGFVLKMNLEEAIEFWNLYPLLYNLFCCIQINELLLFWLLWSYFSIFLKIFKDSLTFFLCFQNWKRYYLCIQISPKLLSWSKFGQFFP